MTLLELQEYMEDDLEYEFEDCFSEFKIYKYTAPAVEDNYSDLFQATDYAKSESSKLLDDFVGKIEKFFQENETSLKSKELEDLMKMGNNIYPKTREIREIMDRVVTKSLSTSEENGTAVNYCSRKVQAIVYNEYMNPVYDHWRKVLSKLKRARYLLDQK